MKPADRRASLNQVAETTSCDARLISALGRVSDRLADTIPPPPTPKDPQWSWGRDAASFPPDYWHWINQRLADEREDDDGAPERALPTDGPLLSIVVPVYRPSLWYFRECVQSVIDQSYQNWELCLCDDGSGDPALTELMGEFVRTDPRIKTVALERNGGISRASNEAMSLAAGEFIVLLDHDDMLEPSALSEVASVILIEGDADVIYSDEDKLDSSDRLFQPHFKPDWDPDLLLGYPYLGHLLAIRHDVVRFVGGFRPEFDGSQDYDLMLRSTELARGVIHIPKVLYHWRVVDGSAAGDPNAKPWAHLASRRALEDAVVRRGIHGVVESGPFPGAYSLRRVVEDAPSVGVIIPFRDQAALTLNCLAALERAPGFGISEVILVDNGSHEPETRAMRQELEERPATSILDYPGVFNWAAINNFAAANSTSDMLLFMNNDIEATSEGWLHAMVEIGQRPEVGAVGARLVYPDGKLQHAGVVLGMGGVAGHVFIGMPPGERGYFAWDQLVRGYSAVTAACMLVRRSVFEELDGFNEDLAVGFNDVDFCIRMGQKGYRVVYTPHAELTHHESVSRGLSGYYSDYEEFLELWSGLLAKDDPSYNRNLSRLNPWCPLRSLDENERWLKMVDNLVPASQRSNF